MENQPTNYASFGQRFLAFLIDIIILTVISWILFAIMGVSMFSGMESFDPEAVSNEEAIEMATKGIGALMMASLLNMVINLAYFSYFESSPKQGTLGKQALGIIVTDMEGDRLSFGKALLRNIGRIISGMILLIGYLMAAFTEKKQALHDLIASTLVLKP